MTGGTRRRQICINLPLITSTNKATMHAKKTATKKGYKNNLEKRRALSAAVLPEVRKLVQKYDLASVQAAVKSLYENRRAEKELADAEARVASLKKRLG